jgi:hypothetical protein
MIVSEVKKGALFEIEDEKMMSGLRGVKHLRCSNTFTTEYTKEHREIHTEGLIPLRL